MEEPRGKWARFVYSEDGDDMNGERLEKRSLDEYNYEEMKAEYYNDIALVANTSFNATPPDGSVKELIEEVKEIKDGRRNCTAKDLKGIGIVF